ncbi:hypothetical protein AX17_006688 [Amanita inopinata Kibby_2008]|nr:hypothetical protein AX17_006688 [Amanita inopinata Kibby_2008]
MASSCSSLLPLVLLVTSALAHNIAGNLAFGSRSTPDWNYLSQQVGGRLYQGVPFAQPCYTQGFNSSECVQVRGSYLDELARSNTTSAHIQTQWETCQVTGEQCLLDWQNLSDEAPVTPPRHCGQGSVSNYYIDVQNSNDVAAAFLFSKGNGVPLVIKNTGHDYKGRSSAPGSLALWMHNLKNITYDPDFVPEGCTSGVAPNMAVTMGAGVQWIDAYGFADSNNITLVGGSDRSVGTVGGWLQGGGHSALSNTMGLGVDRVLEYKVVTPDGQYRTVNQCQNQDLFFALRGGGGGTFGVVLESTVLASPVVTLQTVIVTFQPNATLTNDLWTILADNGLKWADEGWGGFSVATAAIMINPNMSASDAATSMQPLIQFGQNLQAQGVQGVQVIVTTFPTWKSFFDSFVGQFQAIVGANLAIGSRLIPRTNFETSQSRSRLVSAFEASEAATPGLIILISAPSTFPHVENATSVTEAWRDAVYHVTLISTWEWNATATDIKAVYDAVTTSVDGLRNITVGGGAYNEADVYEPDFETTFWGSNYPALLDIKNK